MSSVYVDDTTWMEPWMPPFRTYLSNRLIVYFNEHPTINPGIFIENSLKYYSLGDNTLKDIIFSKDENGNLYIPDETILNKLSNTPDGRILPNKTINDGLIGLIESIILKAEDNDRDNFISSLATPELKTYIENWKEPSGGKKTRKYRKRKTHRGKTRRGKTRRSKTRRSRR